MCGIIRQKWRSLWLKNGARLREVTEKKVNMKIIRMEQRAVYQQLQVVHFCHLLFFPGCSSDCVAARRLLMHVTLSSSCLAERVTFLCDANRRNRIADVLVCLCFYYFGTAFTLVFFFFYFFFLLIVLVCNCAVEFLLLVVSLRRSFFICTFSFE